MPDKLLNGLKSEKRLRDALMRHDLSEDLRARVERALSNTTIWNRVLRIKAAREAGAQHDPIPNIETGPRTTIRTFFCQPTQNRE